MKIKMNELKKMNVNVDKIQSMNFRHLKNGKGKFYIKINKVKYKIDIDTAFNYWYLYDFLIKICSDSNFNDWLKKHQLQYAKQQVNCVMAFIKFDRTEKTIDTEISHIELVKILLNHYNDFDFNAACYGNFNENYKKAIGIMKNRKVA